MLIENKHFIRLREPENLLPHTTTPFPAASPYSSFVPNLITHQVLPRNYGYVIRCKATKPVGLITIVIFTIYPIM
ncbi:MAG: hypothetical protein ACYSW0_17785, partial [Planctomycetota bacterium]